MFTVLIWELFAGRLMYFASLYIRSEFARCMPCRHCSEKMTWIRLLGLKEKLTSADVQMGKART